MTIITCSKTAVSNTTWIKTAPNHLWLIHSTKQLSQGHVMMFPWLLANSTNLIILSETLEINVRPTSKIYCQQWRDSTKTLGKIHKYKLLRKIMDYWRFTICENKTHVRLTVVMTTLHPLQSQTRHNAGAAAPAWELRIHMATGGLQHRSCCSTPGSCASTWPRGACNTGAAAPRLGTQHPHGHGGLAAAHQQQCLRRQRQASETKSQLADAIWPSASEVFSFIKTAIRQETSQLAFAIYMCSPWKAYLQKIQVTSGEALDKSHVEKGRLFTWNL